MSQPKLGFIFIIDYTVYNKLFDQQVLRDMIKDLETGLFNFSKYRLSRDVEFYFITCITEKETFGSIEKVSPNTFVRKLSIRDNKYVLDPVVNFGAVNLGNKDVLSSILIYVEDIIDAEQYIIFLYAHSSNFGFFDSRIEKFALLVSNITKAKVDSDLRNKNLELSKFTNGSLNVISDNERHDFGEAFEDSIVESIKARAIEDAKDFKADMLTNGELQVALLRAFPKKNVKIIFNAGCYTQNIDTLYSLSTVAEYVVGAQSNMPERSFDFPLIVNLLIDEANKHEPDPIDYESIIKRILEIANVETHIRNNMNLSEIKRLDTLFLSAIRCKQVHTLKETIHRFVIFCLSNPEITLDAIKTSRDELKDISTMIEGVNSTSNPLFIFDLVDFFEQFHRKLNHKQLSAEFENLKKSIAGNMKAMLVDKYLGKNAVENGVNRFNGVSLYFPSSGEQAFNTYNFNTFYSPYSDFQSSFAKETLWQEFILFYHKYLGVTGSVK